MIEDGEPMTLAVTNIVKARRDHSCSECGGRIRRGSSYENVHGLCDGIWQTFKTCLPCVNGPRDWLSDECGGWLYGAVREDIQEHLSDLIGWEPATEELMVLKRHEVGMRLRRVMAA